MTRPYPFTGAPTPAWRSAYQRVTWLAVSRGDLDQIGFNIGSQIVDAGELKYLAASLKISNAFDKTWFPVS